MDAERRNTAYAEGRRKIDRKDLRVSDDCEDSFPHVRIGYSCLIHQARLGRNDEKELSGSIDDRKSRTLTLTLGGNLHLAGELL